DGDRGRLRASRPALRPGADTPGARPGPATGEAMGRRPHGAAGSGEGLPWCGLTGMGGRGAIGAGPRGRPPPKPVRRADADRTARGRTGRRGRSNKEIARALHVTVSTVEAHLSRVYAKLGVRSRAQLASRLPSASRP